MITKTDQNLPPRYSGTWKVKNCDIPPDVYGLGSGATLSLQLVDERAEFANDCDFGRNTKWSAAAFDCLFKAEQYKEEVSCQHLPPELLAALVSDKLDCLCCPKIQLGEQNRTYCVYLTVIPLTDGTYQLVLFAMETGGQIQMNGNGGGAIGGEHPNKNTNTEDVGDGASQNEETSKTDKSKSGDSDTQNNDGGAVGGEHPKKN
ncbi:MAG: hypothetical protein MJA83_12230 [Gammaproteobacteria bacterium]|nr:hypothetical protein [Gammaproteobacteria bacterium]